MYISSLIYLHTKKKEIMKVYAVMEKTVYGNEETNIEIRLVFSSRKKAMEEIKWLRTFSENHGTKFEYSENSIKRWLSESCWIFSYITEYEVL